MKRLLILMMVLGLSLSGCVSRDKHILSDADLKELPYYSYLSKNNPVVTITVKDVGVIKLQLFPEVAKSTVDNFIKYIKEGSYSNSPFHRIIEDFMIQGGKVTNSNCEIVGEFSSNGIVNRVSHERGIISMARTNVMDSATSQFFIVHQRSIFLNGAYAAFGGLVGGFDILDLLATVQTGYQDVPIEDVVIKSMSVKLNGYKTGDINCAR